MFNDTMLLARNEDKYDVVVDATTLYTVERRSGLPYAGRWVVTSADDVNKEFPLPVEPHRHDIFEMFKSGMFPGFGKFNGRASYCERCGRFVIADIHGRVATHRTLPKGELCVVVPEDEKLKAKFNAWAERFWAAPREPLREPETLRLLKDPDYTTLIEGVLSDTQAWRLFELRAFAIDLVLSKSVTAFFVVSLESPAELVMYLYALKHRVMQRSMNKVELSYIELLFGDGLLTKDALRSIWTAQKLESGANLLDFFDRSKFFRPAPSA